MAPGGGSTGARIDGGLVDISRGPTRASFSRPSSHSLSFLGVPPWLTGECDAVVQVWEAVAVGGKG